MESEMAAGGVTLSASNKMLALLGSQDWEPMLKELLCYAMTRIKDREWLSVWGGQPPGAKEAHDVVMDSVIDVIDGVRRMPEGVPIIAFLKYVVRSKISHLVECWENKRTTRIPADGDELDVQWDGAAPDSETVSDETEKQNSRLLDLLMSFASVMLKLAPQERALVYRMNLAIGNFMPTLRRLSARARSYATTR